MNSKSTSDNTNLNSSVSIEEKAIALANKLQSGFALNQENYEFLINNFSMRLSHKKILTPEEKQLIIDIVSPLAANGMIEFAEDKPSVSKAERQNIENLKTQISIKTELYNSLEQSVSENQASLIEEEKTIEFLDRNYAATLEELDVHVNSYTPDETLLHIFEANETVNEKERVEKNPGFYTGTGGLFNNITKLKVSLFSSTPQSVSDLQHLVGSYENKKNIVADLSELRAYLLNTTSLEAATQEAETKVNSKNQEIKELIDGIENDKNKMKALEKEIVSAQHQLDKLEPQINSLSFKDASAYLVENLALVLKEENTKTPEFEQILEKTFGATFKTQLPSLISTHDVVNSSLAQNVEILEHIIQLSQTQKKQTDFGLKRATTEEEKENLRAKTHSVQQPVLVALECASEKINNFFSAAFDSNVDDYLDNSLSNNKDLVLSAEILQNALSALSNPTSKISSTDGPGKNKI